MHLVTGAPRDSRALRHLGFGVIDNQIPVSEVRSSGKISSLTGKFRHHLEWELGAWKTEVWSSPAMLQKTGGDHQLDTKTKVHFPSVST